MLVYPKLFSYLIYKCHKSQLISSLKKNWGSQMAQESYHDISILSKCSLKRGNSLRNNIFAYLPRYIHFKKKKKKHA